MKKLTYISLLFCLFGCSFKWLVIPNLDYIITNRIEDSIPLTSSEKDSLSKDIKIVLNQIKPNIKKLKERLIKLDLTKINLKEEYESLGYIYYETALIITPILANYLLSLNGDKTFEFFKALDEKNKKLLKDHKSKQDKDYFERFEYFFGDLKEKQIIQIKKMIPHFKLHSYNRIQARLMIQKKLKGILSNTDQITRRKQLINLFNNHSDRRKTPPHIKNVINEMIPLLTSLDEKQTKEFNTRREQFISWLDKYLKTEY